MGGGGVMQLEDDVEKGGGRRVLPRGGRGANPYGLQQEALQTAKFQYLFRVRISEPMGLY